MGDEQLTKAERAHLRFLRNEVDKCEHEANRVSGHPDVKNDLYRARVALAEYCKELRRAGVDI